MADRDDDVPKGTAALRDLPPELVAALFRDLLTRLPPTFPVPPPAPPSGAMTGADARQIVQHPDADIDALERVVQILLMAKGMTREQIERFVADQIGPFLDRAEIHEECLGAAYDLLDAIGLPVRETKEKKATEEALKALLGLIRSKDGTLDQEALDALRFLIGSVRFCRGVAKKVGFVLAIAAVWAFLKWIGIKGLPNAPGFGE